MIRRSTPVKSRTATRSAVDRSNPGVEASHAVSSSLGRIAISSDAIAQIVGHTTPECYGVVGMAAKGRVGRLLPLDRLRQGITVGGGSEGLRIDLYVVVEYGLNLAEVAAAIRSRVAYEVERLTGLPVAAVEVHIQDVRGAK
jgi:uncharacterized alkaline shock family protein YloU